MFHNVNRAVGPGIKEKGKIQNHFCFKHVISKKVKQSIKYINTKKPPKKVTSQLELLRKI